MKLKSEKDFRGIPGLRLKRNKADKSTSALCTNRYRKDELFFWGPGKLAIYYCRNTTALAKWRHKKLTKGEKKNKWISETYREDLSIYGEYDGILVFEPRTIKDIPRAFFTHRKMIKQK
jgi:hypothetical protein